MTIETEDVLSGFISLSIWSVNRRPNKIENFCVDFELKIETLSENMNSRL